MSKMKIEKSSPNQTAQRVTMRWAIAIAVILLLGFMGWKFLLEKQRGGATPSAEQMNQMYAKNFSPFLIDMSDPAVRSDTITPLDQFNIDYWTGHYQDAVNHFKNLDEELQRKHGLQFRYANSLLSIGKFDEAKGEFQYIADHGPSLHATESFWYLGLIELHRGNADQAREYLNTYRNSMNPLLPRQADNLLRQLYK